MDTFEQSVRRMTPISARPQERRAVSALRELLQAVADLRVAAPRCELRGPQGELIPLPESIFYVLKQVVEVMAEGDAITLVPVGRELTTQQAADLLNVSRQYLVRLLDENKIPFSRTGKHRRLKIEDVLRFKSQRDRERHAALDDLASLTQDIGGYEELQPGSKPAER